MKICAAVCEFNPFHNGHKYFLEQARKKSECDVLLCVMSGNFVQRCEPAITDKSLRAKSALCNGADIVAELPVLYSTANAECFAYGAINIIKQFKNVTNIAFGCETDNIEAIEKLAEIRLNESETFKNNLKSFLDKGLPYPSAHANSTSIEAEKYGIDSTLSDKILQMPNNLLAIEYCKQLKKQNCNVKPIPIQRVGANHNDNSIHEIYSSAGSVREKIFNGSVSEVKPTLPDSSYSSITDAIKSNKLPDMTLFKELIFYSLRTKDLSSLFDAGEGIEIKLKKCALNNTTLDNTITETKTKRYTYVRLNRLCLQALLGIYKNSLFSDPSIPVRLLGIKQTLKKEISNICDTFIIKNKDLNSLSLTHKEYIRTEETAAAVYSQITKTENAMYRSKLIEI